MQIYHNWLILDSVQIFIFLMHSNYIYNFENWNLSFKKEEKTGGAKKSKVDPNDSCNYYKELGHWKWDNPKKAQNFFVVALV